MIGFIKRRDVLFIDHIEVHDSHVRKGWASYILKTLFDSHIEVEDIDLMVESKGEKRKWARDLYAAWGAPGPSTKPANRRIFRPGPGEEYRSISRSNEIAERRIEEGSKRGEGMVVHETLGQWEGAEGDGRVLAGMLEAGQDQQLVRQVSAGLERGGGGEMDGIREILKDSQYIVVGGIRHEKDARGSSNGGGEHRTILCPNQKK